MSLFYKHLTIFLHFYIITFKKKKKYFQCMDSFLSFQNRSIHLQIIYCLYDKINEECIIEFNNFLQKSFPKCITIRFRFLVESSGWTKTGEEFLFTFTKFPPNVVARAKNNSTANNRGISSDNWQMHGN